MKNVYRVISMRIDLMFHAKMDRRGKLQIPKREYEARNWSAGTVFVVTVTPYEPSASQKYQAIRTSILERDGHKCQKCGSTTRIRVHHLVPKIHGGTDDPSNLATLCAGCHRKAHVATGQNGFAGKRIKREEA